MLLAVLGTTGCRRGPDAALQRHLTRASAYAAEANLHEAIIEYRNALRVDDRRVDVRVKLADAYLSVGDLAGGLSEYLRAASLRPDDTALQIKVGQLLLLASRFDLAKALAEKVLARNPRDIDAQVLVANALAGLQNFDAAVAQVEDAIRMNPSRGDSYADLGALELRRGNVAQAEHAFKKAVELAPRSGGAHAALANFYWARGAWVDAERELLEALRLSPDSALFNRALASFYYATHRRHEAEAPLRKVLDLTRAPAAALALADYYVAVNNDAAAEALLKPLLEGRAQASGAAVRLAAIAYRHGDRDGARARVDEVLARDPRDLQALLVKSALLADEGRLADALAVATQASAAHPDSTAAAFAVGRIRVAQREPQAAMEAFETVLRLNPRATDAKIALARLKLAAGRADAAVLLAEEAVGTDPDNAAARLALVRALMARGDLDQAATELEALVRRLPASAATHTLKGLLLARQGKGAAARAEFERAQQLEPASLEALGGLVAVDIADRRVAAARERVMTRLATEPRSPGLLLLAARTAEAAGDLAAAEQHLLRAIDADSARLPAYRELGRLYVIQHRLEAARWQFERLAARLENPIGALTILGMIQQVQGDAAGARARYERVLALDPAAPVAANNLAYMYASAGERLDEALQLAQTAHSRLPDVADVSDTLGFVYYRKGLAPLAVSTLAPIATAEPENATYQFHLGLAYAMAGDPARARAALLRALALNKDFDGADQAVALLSRLPLR